jgi:hypothetical protein
MHRERGTERFMLDADLDRLVEWLAGLRCPGVLVLGQPLHAIPVSRWKGLFETIDIITDINLPAFTQFARLAQALQRAPHDVCVLSGDVHFGRVASVELFREGDIEPMRLFEVHSFSEAGCAARGGDYCRRASVAHDPLQRRLLAAVRRRRRAGGRSR